MKLTIPTALLSKPVLTHTALAGSVWQADILVKKSIHLPHPLSTLEPTLCFPNSARKQNTLTAPDHPHLPQATHLSTAELNSTQQTSRIACDQQHKYMNGEGTSYSCIVTYVL